jgi:hypothetical protein
MFGLTIIRTKNLIAVREQVKTACLPGNFDYDPYLHGMANGLICALATIDGYDPEYILAPKKWGNGKHSHTNPKKKAQLMTEAAYKEEQDMSERRGEVDIP